MTVTAALVRSGHNYLRYLLTSDGSGGSATLTTTGAATPDLQTDCQAGPLKTISRAFDDGIGDLPAGAKTQAQSRALWLSNDPTSVVGNENAPRAICETTPIAGAGVWTLDANVDGSGHPTVIATSSAAAGTCYLDVLVPGSIGR